MDIYECEARFKFDIIPGPNNIRQISRELAKRTTDDIERQYYGDRTINFNGLQDKVEREYNDIFELIANEINYDLTYGNLFADIGYESNVPEQLGFTSINLFDLSIDYESITGNYGWVDSIVRLAADKIIRYYLDHEDYMQRIDLDLISFGNLSFRLNADYIRQVVDIDYDIVVTDL